MDKLDFVLYYTIFLIFISQLIGMMAADINIIEGAIVNPPDFSPTSQIPEGIFGGATWIFSNFSRFFRLMFVSSEFMLFSVFIITPYIIGIFWCLLEIIKDLIPTT